MDPNWLAQASQDAMRRRMMENKQGADYMQQVSPLWMQSGMQQSPPVVPGQQLRQAVQPMVDQVMANRQKSVLDRFGEMFARRDEQGAPQAPGAWDYVNAAMMAMPGMRGGRGGPAFAAEKGAGSGGGGRSNWLNDLISEKKAPASAPASPPASPPSAAIERAPSDIPGEWRKMGQAAYDEGFTHAKRGIGRRQGVYDQANYDKGFFAGRDGPDGSAAEKAAGSDGAPPSDITPTRRR